MTLLDQALSLAGTDTPAPRAALARTLEKTLTRRAVLWLGQTCNLKCEFCYFIDRVADRSHPEHAFMPLEKAKKICRTVRDHYGNTAIDIQGGEPTLYQGIFELVRYCNEIELSPTLITNALLLDNLELCRTYRDAGVSDFLISVQGLGAVHDQVVGCPGAHRRQMAALRNLQEVGIPFRFNVVMSKEAVPQLPDIARLAVETGAFVVNFIAFNPFGDQAEDGKRKSDNVPRYSEVTPHLTQALDLLEEAGVEANVRYFPFCMVEERHRKHIYNFQQLSYDPHEWDFASWTWTGLQPQRTAAGEPSPPAGLSVSRGFKMLREPMKRLAANTLLRPFLYAAHAALSRSPRRRGDPHELYRKVAEMHAEDYCGYQYGAACQGCSLRPVCDGIHDDYAEIFGTGEFSAVTGSEPVQDQRHFISRQLKYLPVTPESYAP